MSTETKNLKVGNGRIRYENRVYETSETEDNHGKVTFGAVDVPLDPKHCALMVRDWSAFCNQFNLSRSMDNADALIFLLSNNGRGNLWAC